MNAIESDLYTTEGLEPGTTLAKAIGERMLSMNSNETIQPISSILSNTDSERQSLNDFENIKYKTELCRNYSVHGFCSYSSRCQFAHGIEELRCRTRHPKYKTEYCRNFLSGFCKYGSRCQFLHDLNPTNEPLPSHDNLIAYPTAVAALGTYLLTNMLAHSAAFRSGSHSLNYGIEMQQISPGIFLPQNQNNHDSQLSEDSQLNTTIKKNGKSFTRI